MRIDVLRPALFHMACSLARRRVVHRRVWITWAKFRVTRSRLPKIESKDGRSFASAMSAVPSTPRANQSKLTTPAVTPTATRAVGSHALQSSPYYTTTRRHSLYGTEDRVVIDPGSRIWKVGFSGEGKPRDVFYANSNHSESLWSWSRPTDPSARAEEDRILEINIEKCMRSVFHE